MAFTRVVWLVFEIDLSMTMSNERTRRSKAFHWYGHEYVPVNPWSNSRRLTLDSSERKRHFHSLLIADKGFLQRGMMQSLWKINKSRSFHSAHPSNNASTVSLKTSPVYSDFVAFPNLAVSNWRTNVNFKMLDMFLSLWTVKKGRKKEKNLYGMSYA